MVSTNQAILTTLLYSDLFNFPLTKDEIWRYLITKRPMNRSAFDQALSKRVGHGVSYSSGYYCLQGREKIIQRRKRNHIQREKKLHIARYAAYYLSFIPMIKLIGVSGGLSMGNVTKDDDIDFFIITQKGTVFLTRLFVLSLLEVMKLRRQHKEKYPADKVCVNFFLDETKLTLGKERREIYTAHEIAQLQVLFERDELYKKFINHNAWVHRYLPNAIVTKQNIPGDLWQTDYYSLRFLGFILNNRFIENAIRLVQLFFINRHRTTEIVTKRVLAFHPNNYRSKTIQDLKTRMTELGLLTNF